MSMSTGTRRVLREAASWGLAIVIGVAALMNIENLRPFTGGFIDHDFSNSVAQDEDKNRRADTSASELVTLSASRNGHYYSEADINGRSINVLVDTGATTVALSYEDAERAGIFVNPSDFTLRSRTANGVARAAPVMLDSVQIGGITVHNVQATVAEPGRLHITLLGMSFLKRLARFEMRRGRLILEN